MLKSKQKARPSYKANWRLRVLHGCQLKGLSKTRLTRQRLCRNPDLPPVEMLDQLVWAVPYEHTMRYTPEELQEVWSFASWSWHIAAKHVTS